MSTAHEDWQAVVNAILVDHEERLRAMEDLRFDIGDPEYAMPGELEAYKAPARRVEAWPDKAERRIAALERRLFALETEVGHLRDDLRRLAEQAGNL